MKGDLFGAQSDSLENDVLQLSERNSDALQNDVDQLRLDLNGALLVLIGGTTK